MGMTLAALVSQPFAFIALAWVPFFLPPWIDVATCWDILLRLLYVK